MSGYQLPIWIWGVVLVSVCAVAVWRGGNHERLAAGTIVLGWAFTILAWRQTEETQWWTLLVDAAELPVFFWIALRSVRYWPLFAAALKLLIVVTHLGRALDPSIGGWAYLTAGILWSYLALFTVGYAAWTAPRYAESAGEPTEAGATRR